MSEDELWHRRFKLNEATVKIKHKFARLVLDLQRHLKKTGKPEDVFTLLKVFYGKVTYEKLIGNCKSLTEVFDKISSIASFFDYDVIKLLAHKLGSPSIKKKMTKYKKRFQEFSKCCICECPKNGFDDGVKSEKVYVIKINKSLNSLTVEETQKLKYEMNSILGHELLRFMCVEDGCVQLTFCTLKSDNLNIPIEAQQKLRKLGVLSVSYGNKVVPISEILSITDDNFGEPLNDDIL